MAEEDLQRCLGGGEKFTFSGLGLNGLTCKNAHEEVNSLSLLDLTCKDAQEEVKS